MLGVDIMERVNGTLSSEDGKSKVLILKVI